MQLLCNGVYVDLYDDTRVQFTHDNPLFAFDNLKCERTTEFKLPTTPVNDRLFALARVPAYTGDGMRRKFAAQLQAGAVVKNGYLYVSAYDGKDYAAVFVTGEYVGLQDIKNAGKLSDIIPDTGLLARWTNRYPSDPVTDFDPVVYSQIYGGSAHVPSIRLKWLINQAFASIGKTAPSISDTYRIILAKPKTASGKITQNNTPGEAWSSNYQTTAVLNTLSFVDGGSSVAEMFRSITYKIRYRATRTPNYMYGYIKQFLCSTQSVTLSFPSNFSSDYFLLSFPATAAQDPSNDPDVYKEEISPGVYGSIPGTIGVFLGDYSFKPNQGTDGVTISGEPLAGRTIEIPAGKPFILLNRFDFENYISSGQFGWYTPYRDGDVITYLQERNAEPGDVIPIYGNIPDWNIIDLLKLYAALTGSVLTYSETDGIIFDNLSSGWNTIEIKDIISIQKVERRFGDYAQRNYVRFKGDDTQSQSDKLETVYTIINDNIKEENTLQEFQMSEGCKIIGDSKLLIRNTEEEPAPKEYTIGVYYQDYLRRVNLIRNSVIQNLCDSSTQIQVQVRMGIYEYMQITGKTILLLQGTNYVWTSSQWGNNVGVFTLAKIP